MTTKETIDDDTVMPNCMTRSLLRLDCQRVEMTSGRGSIFFEFTNKPARSRSARNAHDEKKLEPVGVAGFPEAGARNTGRTGCPAKDEVWFNINLASRMAGSLVDLPPNP